MTDFLREFMEQIGEGRVAAPLASRRMVLLGGRRRSTSERLAEMFLRMRPGERAIILSPNPEHVERLSVVKVVRECGFGVDVLRPEELRPKTTRRSRIVVDEPLLGSFRAGRQGGRSPEWHRVVLHEAMCGWDPWAERAKYESLPIWRRNDPDAI